MSLFRNTHRYLVLAHVTLQNGAIIAKTTVCTSVRQTL